MRRPGARALIVSALAVAATAAVVGVESVSGTSSVPSDEGMQVLVHRARRAQPSD